MSETMTFQLEGLEDALKLFNPKISEAVAKQAVFDVYAKADNLVANELQRRIYDQPQTIRAIETSAKGKQRIYTNYRRTGRAKKGHTNRRDSKVDDYTRKLVYASTLAGADLNYTPYLNRNSRIKKLNTHFWDDSIYMVKANLRSFFKESFKKVLARRNTSLEVIEYTTPSI